MPNVRTDESRAVCWRLLFVLLQVTEEQERKRQQEEARKREEDRIRRDIEEKENEEAKVLHPNPLP